MSGFSPPGSGGGSPTVKKNNVAVATRQGINLIEGANVTLTVADDAGNNEVDVTIAASVSGASGVDIKEEGGAATTVTSIDFVGSMTTASAVGAAGTLTTAHGTQAGGTTHPDVVAAGASGFMSGADKTKLDGISAGANVGVNTQDEGIAAGSSQTTLNFVGAGVTAASVGATTTITIPGGGAGNGVIGAPGMDGADGVDGAQGPPGATGATGPAGPAGQSGLIGMDGADGMDGDYGPPGPAGPQGIAGNNGATGAQGPLGPAVFLLDEATDGEPGPPGPAGATGATGATGAGGANDATYFSFVDDFMSATTTFRENWFVSVSGDSLTSNSATGINAAHAGIAVFNGSTTAGRSSLSNAIGGVILGATTGGWMMETLVYVDTLDSGTNNYTIIIGLGDSFTSATQTNGIYFRYSGGTNSGQWQLVSTASGSSTTINGGAGAAMTAGVWWKLRWQFNAAGNSLSADYNIANAGYVSLGTALSTGFPTSQIGPIVGKFNSGAGAGSRIMRVDYYGLTATLAR